MFFDMLQIHRVSSSGFHSSYRLNNNEARASKLDDPEDLLSRLNRPILYGKYCTQLFSYPIVL